MAKRKKVPEKKKRNEHIYATTSGNVSEIALTVDSRTGEIRFANEMINVYSETSYDRENTTKGPKVISRIPQARPSVSFDAAPALLKNFDFLCAVDTNGPRVIDGRQVHVVGIVIFKSVTIPEASGLKKYWQFDVPFCLEYIGIKPEIPAENFGWMAAHEHLHRFGIVNAAQRIGMVVDSDLGNLNDYNLRKKPFVGPDFLHEQVTLIYASADVGKDNIVNKVLAAADSAATQVLNALQAGEAPTNQKPPIDGAWYENSRVVRPK